MSNFFAYYFVLSTIAFFFLLFHGFLFPSKSVKKKIRGNFEKNAKKSTVLNCGIETTMYKHQFIVVSKVKVNIMRVYSDKHFNRRFLFQTLFLFAINKLIFFRQIILTRHNFFLVESKNESVNQI